jgi:tRNA-Thr(GGU) m(6)t(6)A37 methyltransferase TsaA
MKLSENKAKPKPEMCLRAVGIVSSPLHEPSLVADSGDLEWRPQISGASESQEVISELVIDSDLAGIIDGLEDFSHLLVLYWAHCIDEDQRSIVRAHPIGRKDLPLVGIFATCSPARPNPVCAMVVRLLERKGNILKVQGLDAIDGSPLVGIKPYNPSYYVAEDVKVADWMAQIYREIAQGKC